MTVLSKPLNRSNNRIPMLTVAPIPLEPMALKDAKKDELIKLDLRVDPASSKSETYNFSVRTFKQGTVEELLNWYRDYNKVLIGMNITAAKNKLNMARNLLAGEALRVFNNKAEGINDPVTEDDVETILQELFKHFFPQKALARQKRYMRRNLRKPRSMKIREFVERITEMNEHLMHFPPANKTNKLPPDEILEIVEFAAPNNWQRELHVQGLDFLSEHHTLHDLVEFFERLETAEEIYDGASPNPDRKGGLKSNDPYLGAKSAESTTKSKNKKRKEAPKWCELHETDRHSTADCKILLDQAKRMRSQWKSKNATSSPSRKKGNEHTHNNHNKELNVMIENAVKSALNKNDRGRKRNKERDNSSESEDNFNYDSDLSDTKTKVDNYLLSNYNRKNTKRNKTTQYNTELIAKVKTNPEGTKSTIVRVLLDTGTSSSLILKNIVKKLKLKNVPQTKWITKGGTFTTDSECKIRFKLPQFSETKEINWQCYVDSSNANARYDMILGRDFLQETGMILNWNDLTMTWDEATIVMPEYGTITNRNEANAMYLDLAESMAVKESSERTERILEARYEKADLNKLVNDCDHLTNNQKEKLYKLLRKYEYLFDGTLGDWRAKPVDFQLKEGATPYHAKAFPVPKSLEEATKKEIERLCKLNVLEKIGAESEWAAPTFIKPKKNGSVRFLSDFRELNKRIRRKPFPLPKIQDLLQKLEGFTYATSLDLNMGYYTIRLTPNAQELCTIIMPWGKYRYKRLPMGVANSPDIFQDQMSDLMAGLEFVRCYLDDILCLTKDTYENHLEQLEKVLVRLASANLKVNIEKSFFAKTELEYLGFWITREGIRPVSKKVEAIRAIAPPKTRKQLRSFIGMVNYYRDVWKRRSHLLAPLSRLTSKSAKWEWTEKEQNAFDTIKKVISRDVLLTYPNFKEKFDIHTDASDEQLGAVISQNGKPIAFYSRKLNSAQKNYTTTERELLSIVETLKEFKNILYGQEIRVYTDHKNLTCKTFNTERVMRWRLLTEEFGPEFIYIKGQENVVADSLSRLEKLENPINEKDLNSHELAELYNVEKDVNNIHPTNFKMISKYQRQDKYLMKKLKSAVKGYSTKSFRGSDIICHNDKIYIPKRLQNSIVTWYHEILCHAGMNRTEETIRQHYTFPNLREKCKQHIGKCDTCQRYKKQKKKYGYVPAKEAEAEPWKTLCVDLIGPYKLKRKGKETLTLQAVTMIDPASGWFEIAEYKDKESNTIANLIEQTWLSRYPWPEKCIYDRGSEFIGSEFQELLKEEYNIKTKPITVKNPQANSILERIHQVLGNMIRTFELEERDIDENDPFSGILAAVAWATRSTYHTTLQATPGQLVFGRDMVLNVTHLANWYDINKRKQEVINQNNKRENSKRIDYDFSVGEKVLIERHGARKIERPYDGPYKIVRIHTNGTITIERGAITERINIRRVHPYHE